MSILEPIPEKPENKFDGDNRFDFAILACVIKLFKELFIEAIR